MVAQGVGRLDVTRRYTRSSVTAWEILGDEPELACVALAMDCLELGAVWAEKAPGLYSSSVYFGCLRSRRDGVHSQITRRLSIISKSLEIVRHSQIT